MKKIVYLCIILHCVSSVMCDGREQIKERLRVKVNKIFPPASSDRLRYLILRNRDTTFPSTSSTHEEHHQAPVNATPYIVGGSEVNPKGKYPFMVGAYFKDSLGLYQVCGASLIAPSYVLCAAHCSPYVTSVRIGMHNKVSDSNYESFNVVQEIKHPKWDRDTLAYDFMVLKINGTSKYSPVSLDDGSINLVKGTSLTVIGWGQTSEGENAPTSNNLLEAQVSYVTNSDCNSFNAYGGQVRDMMMCAAGQGKDACQGDSGGPLIITGSNTQVGVVSWGFGCANPRYPGVYSRISKVNSWIMNVISGSVPSQPSPPVVSPTPPTQPSNPSPSVPTPSGCKDVDGWVDEFFDNCSWYPLNDPGCVFWSGTTGTNGLTAAQACCECGGGITTSPSNPSNPTPPVSPSPPVVSPTPPTQPSNPSPSVPTQPSVSGCSDFSGFVDMFGDSCSWYNKNYPNSCSIWGNFAVGPSGYSPKEACCVCGGGNSDNNNSPSLPSTEKCQDQPSWIDQYNDSCKWYVLNEDPGCTTWGNTIGSGNMSANQACCHCGGGLTAPSSPNSPSLSPPVSPTSPISSPSGSQPCLNVAGWYVINVNGAQKNCNFFDGKPNKCNQNIGNKDGVGGLSAKEACCVCKTESSSSSPPPPPSPPGTLCTDVSGWYVVNVNGAQKNCNFFDGNPNKCNKNIGSKDGVGGLSAKEACCACR